MASDDLTPTRSGAKTTLERSAPASCNEAGQSQPAVAQRTSSDADRTDSKPTSTARQKRPSERGARKKKARKKTKDKGRRPCAKDWPTRVCECDAHLGAFVQPGILREAKALLQRNAISFIDNVFRDENKLALHIDDMARAESLLAASSLPFERITKATSINPYDFPLLRNGIDLQSVIPNQSTELKVLPPYRCPERRMDALALAVTLSSYVDLGSVRCYLSRAADTRTQALNPVSRQPLHTLSNIPERAIDVVITTVDGADPQWRRRFDAALASAPERPALAKALNAARYTNRDELRYVLRSIYYYAPYVRRIHIVTDQQQPDWIDPNSDRIHFVDHADIIERRYRPTFSSDSIESFLWRIPGLADDFLYFNDDVLLMGPTSPRTFFARNGSPKIFRSPRRLPSMPLSWVGSYTTHAHLRTADALAAKGFGFGISKFKHAPFAASKNLWKQLEKTFKKELAACRRSRFRSEQSYATFSFLYPNYALATQQAIASRLPYRYVDLAFEDWEKKFVDACARTDIKAMCINESDDAVAGNAVTERVPALLSVRFPIEAPWEKIHNCQASTSLYRSGDVNTGA